MWSVVVLVGAFILGACLYFSVRIETLSGLVDKVFATRWIYLAALVRLMLGAALLASAHAVGFPRAIAAIGWLFALSGLTLVAVPQPALLRMARWMTGLPLGILRLWLSLGALFGGFMLYAALA